MAPLFYFYGALLFPEHIQQKIIGNNTLLVSFIKFFWTGSLI